MYLLRDNPVKAPNRAIRRALSTARRAALGWAVVLAAAAWAFASAAGTPASAATATSRPGSSATDGSVGGQCPPLPTPADRSSVSCRDDAALTRLFTPRAAPEGSYHVYVSSSAVEKIAGLLKGAAKNGAGGWTVQQMDPLDVFGTAGDYDELAVARLYVGHRPRVARGPVLENGRVVASIWLISPYPDPALTHLEKGTLIIEFRVDGLGK
jgi:hypothetical protein